MKRLVIASIGMLAMGLTTASAADMPARPVYKAPPVIVDPWTWTGFYVGVNAGYSWGRSRTDVDYFDTGLTANGGPVLPIAPPPGSVTSADLKLNGGIAGGQDTIGR